MPDIHSLPLHALEGQSSDAPEPLGSALGLAKRRERSSSASSSSTASGGRSARQDDVNKTLNAEDYDRLSKDERSTYDARQAAKEAKEANRVKRAAKPASESKPFKDEVGEMFKSKVSTAQPGRPAMISRTENSVTLNLGKKGLVGSVRLPLSS